MKYDPNVHSKGTECLTMAQSAHLVYNLKVIYA